jgi:PilZ domain
MPPRVSEHKGIGESSAALKRLERRDWYRWACILTITLVELFGLWSLARPGIKTSLFEQDALQRELLGLFGLVLLFAVFAAYQQFLIAGLRRRLAAQIGMSATLEMLKPEASSEFPVAERRHIQRYHFDQMLKITALLRGRETTLSGWTADISDGGLGAVMPEVLPLRTQATIRFRTERDGPELVIEAVVRHQRGFHHGFEFVGLTPDQLRQIRATYAGAVPLQDLYQDTPPAETKSATARPRFVGLSNSQGLCFRDGLRKAELGFGQRLGKQLLDLELVAVLGHGKLADQQVAGTFQHLLLAER